MVNGLLSKEKSRGQRLVEQNSIEAKTKKKKKKERPKQHASIIAKFSMGK